MDNQDNMLKYALDYAYHGWYVLPLEPKNKMPYGKFAPNGVKNATTDEKTIQKWFEKSKCNLGIATGPQSKFWVLDIDGPVGSMVWWNWEARHEHAFTLAQRTGRPDGGRQLLFQYPEEIINLQDQFHFEQEFPDTFRILLFQMN